MAEYPQTGSVLDSTTRTGLSTQIVIMVNGNPVGAIQSFGENQTRGTKPISEVGTDGQIEIVPSSSTTIELSVTRIVFDGLSVTEAFSRGFRNVASQRYPFDIVVFDKSGGGDATTWITTTYHNCWFKSISKTYSAGDYVIQEQANITAEFMSTSQNTEPVVTQGYDGRRDLGNGIDIDAIEGQADAGINGRRGAMDYQGIFSAAFDE
tara:strand:- start:11513 stop:12136 length:624 start_codon:yes stop_codon:yes gene_type:complete